jgi:hypothetical protein
MQWRRLKACWRVRGGTWGCRWWVGCGGGGIGEVGAVKDRPCGGVEKRRERLSCECQMLSYECVETKQSNGKSGSVGYMCMQQKETGSRPSCSEDNSAARGKLRLFLSAPLIEGSA